MKQHTSKPLFLFLFTDFRIVAQSQKFNQIDQNINHNLRTPRKERDELNEFGGDSSLPKPRFINYYNSGYSLSVWKMATEK